MTYWPYWVGGLALAGVMVLHWFFTLRMMAISGRYTALVNWLREPRDEPQDESMSQAELVEAIRRATEAQFGPQAAPSPDETNTVSSNSTRSSQRPAIHLLMFAGLIAGGFTSSIAWRAFTPVATLHGEGFRLLTGESQAVAFCLLFAGGILVGFGTRMAGGCTSGHGLCGTSRLQPGSWLATVAFFGFGVVTSLVLARFS